MSDHTPADLAAVVADLAREAEYSAAEFVHTGRTDGQDLLVYTLPTDRSLEHVDLERYAPQPYAKRGAPQVYDAASLAGYVNRHKTAATTLWADPRNATAIAVLDDHEPDAVTTGESADPPGIVTRPGAAGWGRHRVSLKLAKTPEWLHWLGRDNKLLDQTVFAEHLEDGAEAIVNPSAATMLEIAESFHASRGLAFRSSTRLSSGEVQLMWDESTEARAGKKGELSIPATFELGLTPFEAGQPYRVHARLRYRLHDGRLSLGYKLVRPDLIERAAVTDMIAEVGTATGLPVHLGTPRGDGA